MIRKNVRLAGICLHEPEQRRAYSSHYCSLCHALADRYGAAYRLLTTHELTLLNLLTNAQRRDAPEFVHRRCPLNPFRITSGNNEISSQFAADAAIALACAKFADDRRDSGGKNIAASLACRLLEPVLRRALGTLGQYGLAPADLANLDALQARAESDPWADPAGPSARVSASLFSLSSHLAGESQNAAALAQAGASFGEFIYLRDALEDLLQDIACQHYNPLRRFCRPVTGGVLLGREGIEWLLARLEALLRNLEYALSQVRFQRYETLVTVLLLQPVEMTVQGVAQRALNREDLYLRLWQPMDALRAGLFLLPGALAEPGQAVFPIGENPFDADERKRRNLSSCTSRDRGCNDWYYCGHGDCSGIDCRDGNCGITECGVFEWFNNLFSGCGDFFSSGDCSSIDCGGIDCSSIDCSGLDCSNVDCSGVDCSGVDCSP